MFRSLNLLFLVSLLLLGACSSKQVITAGTFAPAPESTSDAIIQVYAARTRGAKSALAVHTWISTRKSSDPHYTSYEVNGWRLKYGKTALVTRTGQPDRDWWGNQPELLLDMRGPELDPIIDKIADAVERYPFKDSYQAWPGPNSNTFVAYIGKEVPELNLDLPSTAIGKDYREIDEVLGLTPSGTGIQASLWGLLGLSLGYEEGIELNILGLNFELDIFDLALELPGVGRIGPAAEKPVNNKTVKTTAGLDDNEAEKRKNKDSNSKDRSPPDQ